MNYFEYQSDYIALDKVRLPVMELSQETMTTLFSGSDAMATEAEAAAFTAAKESISPIIVKGNFGGAGFASVAAFVTDSGTGGQCFVSYMGGISIWAMLIDSGWLLTIKNS